MYINYVIHINAEKGLTDEIGLLVGPERLDMIYPARLAGVQCCVI
jgi:hypothetical protein